MRKRAKKISPIDLLNKQQLEKYKLRVEIEKLSKSWWREPTYIIPLVLGIIAAFSGWYSGLFNIQRERIAVETLILQEKKDTLNAAIKKQQFKLDSLSHKYIVSSRKLDSTISVANKYKSEQDSVKKAYHIWQKKNQSKKELQKEVLEFTKKIRELLRKYDIEYSKALNIQKFEAFNEASTNASNNLINNYNIKYKIQAKIYREKLLFFLPDKKDERTVTWDYESPNVLSVKSVADDLEYMAKKIND